MYLRIGKIQALATLFEIILCLYSATISSGGSSLRSWQLTHELSSLKSGVINIDDDLTYLYGQLPERIRSAAVAVMTKKIRKVTYAFSRAFLNFFGFVLG